MTRVNQELFSEEAKDYSRNHIITNLLEGESYKKVKIIPSFRKKSFLSYFLKTDYLINDFFTGAYESNVLDRKKYSPISLKAYSYLFKDWFSLTKSKYVLTDTYKHFLYWQETVGETNAEVFVLPVLADEKIYFPKEEFYKKEQTLKVLFTGSYIPLHGIEKIVDAIKLLKEKNLDIEFKFIGNGQTFPEIKAKVEDLGLSDSITFIRDMIPESQLVEEINKCDVMLGIFGDSTKASVVVPNKVYQGLACKKCVLTMQSSGMREFFNDEEVVLVKNSAEAIAKGVEELYNNRDLVEKFAVNGYEAYQKLYQESKKSFKEFLQRVDNG